ncbi:hypothetical protein [Thermus albus]|uniref:hypothetical protein n=1 Tax=Thermus albus TaxID=2908146 RepID=UPI001FAB34E7|nr:hypothetical protein [Thermus albus]
MEEVLDFIEGTARLLRLEAVKLLEAFRDNPKDLRKHLSRLRELAEELHRIREALYALNVEVRRPYEDNSAEALRRELF